MRAILWDMDGTLLDSEPVHEAAFVSAFAELGIVMPGGFHDSLLGSSTDQVHRLLVQETGVEITFENWIALKWKHFQRNLNLISQRSPTASLVPDFHAREIPMAVVSNSTAAEVRICLEACGLEKFFQITICRSDVETGKPAPDGYQLAAQKLGVGPLDCIVVEDSPTGARAGIAAKMKVIFYPQSTELQAPHGTIEVHPDASPAPLIEAFLMQHKSAETMQGAVADLGT